VHLIEGVFFRSRLNFGAEISLAQCLSSHGSISRHRIIL